MLRLQKRAFQFQSRLVVRGQVIFNIGGRHQFNSPIRRQRNTALAVVISDINMTIGSNNSRVIGFASTACQFWLHRVGQRHSKMNYRLTHNVNFWRIRRMALVGTKGTLFRVVTANFRRGQHESGRHHVGQRVVTFLYRRANRRVATRQVTSNDH